MERVPGSPNVLEVRGLSKSFGKTEALRDVDLVLPEHRVLGLLGPNGAGKTTLIRILATLLLPDRGSVRVAGYDVTRSPVAVRQVIGLAGQYAAVDELLSGRENLEMVGRLYRLSRSEARKRADLALERLSLTAVANRAVRTYSGGTRRRLDLAASLVGRPRLLLLDEPSTGLDPRARAELWAFIRELVDEGTTILLTTQQLEEADQFATDIVVLDHGQVIAADTPTALKHRIDADIVEVTISDRQQYAAAQTALSSLGLAPAHLDPVTGRLSLKVAASSHGLVAVVRRLDEAGIAVTDVAVHHPSLDDVFLTLTGSPTASKPARTHS
jgi:ABC-2 type transport system ATP-binding protein